MGQISGLDITDLHYLWLLPRTYGWDQGSGVGGQGSGAEGEVSVINGVNPRFADKVLFKLLKELGVKVTTHNFLE